MGNAVIRMLTAACMSAAILSGGSAAADGQLTDLSLEELLTLEVTSVARKPQDPAEAATAISVITQEDIRRAGVNNIPDALRLAPGVEVAEIDGTLTAVSIRGFNWRFSNKLLVLIDGRAIYQPTLAGIFWDQQAVPVELIQRIEVIRGPGATVYGANAVNGVINIVTKHAADTLKGLAVAETNFDDRNRALLSYGIPVSNLGALRFYGKFSDVPSLVDANGDAFNAGKKAYQTGFRMDIEPNARDAYTLQGDYFSGWAETTTEFSIPNNIFDGGIQSFQPTSFNILGRWVRTYSPDSAVTLQTYVDYSERDEFNSLIEILTFDVDFSHRFRPFSRADIVWGLNYRRTDDCIDGSDGISFSPMHETTEWISGFAQTEISVIPDRLNVTLGTKLEDNSFTGLEVQPSARFIWLGEADWSIWGAASRAVRTPSRIERAIDIRIGGIEPFSELNPTPITASVSFLGNPDFDAETLEAYELGFRKSWKNGTNLDVALYHQQYDDLIAADLLDPELIFEPTGPGGTLVPTELSQDFLVVNGSNGQISGIEVEYSMPITDWWDLSILGDYRKINLASTDLELGGLSETISLGDSPNWQASVRSDFTITHNLDASVWLRRVGELEFDGAPAYTDLDIRATWRATRRLELSLIGQNLLDNQRLEIDDALYPVPTGFVERRVLLRTGLRF